MDNYKKVISYNIKNIFKEFPSVCEIKNDNGAEFNVSYDAAQKIAKRMKKDYYWGIPIYCDTEEEYQATLKNLLKTKRVLYELKNEGFI